jgi:hypothetical protein
MSDQKQMQQGQAQPLNQFGGAAEQRQQSPQPHLVVDNSKMDEQRRQAAIVSLQERQWAKQIAASERPIIIITEEYAKSAAGLSDIIADIFPNVPVICESAKAEKDFRTGQFCNSYRFRDTLCGHFAQSDVSGQSLQRIAQADCVIVMGTPSKHSAVFKAFESHPNMIVQKTATNSGAPNPRINFSRIEKANRKTQAWKSWLDRVTPRKSL